MRSPIINDRLSVWKFVSNKLENCKRFENGNEHFRDQNKKINYISIYISFWVQTRLIFDLDKPKLSKSGSIVINFNKICQRTTFTH